MAARRGWTLVFACVLAAAACKRGGGSTPAAPEEAKVGLVTDVGGRGDQSFNDGALRGLEMWAAGRRYTAQGYQPLAPADLERSIPADVRAAVKVEPLRLLPVVLQAKQQEDYEPNLQLLVDDGVKLAIGVGFMLENAVEAAAKKNPQARFLLIDSPVLDAQGTPYTLPNVRTLVFREHEGVFLVGALAGMATKSGKVGFVGGMQIPLIRRFEAGFRAGVATTNPQAAAALLAVYTGSFDKVEAGKQVAQDMVAKGADVIFHAAGSDGLGVIAAAREAGRMAIGCDSDQHHVAPDTVITSFIKRVDLAVYMASRDILNGQFQAGHTELGLKEGGVGYAPLSAKLPDRERIDARLQSLRARIVDGALKVPATLEELAHFAPPADPAPPAGPALPAGPATPPPAADAAAK